MAGQGAPLLGLPQPRGGAERGLASGMEVTGEQSTSGSGQWAGLWVALGPGLPGPPLGLGWAGGLSSVPTPSASPASQVLRSRLPASFLRDGAWDKLAGTETSITL